MTQAAGFYNTLLQGDDPGMVVEVLNGYRVKEKLPSNIGDFTVPLGVAEVLRAGSDVTLVSYGATLRIVMETAELLAQSGIDANLNAQEPGYAAPGGVTQTGKRTLP